MGFPASNMTPQDKQAAFQSLIGIYGFSGFSGDRRSMNLTKFQSLIGIYGFSGKSTCRRVLVAASFNP